MDKNQRESQVKFLDDIPFTKDELKLHENIAKTIKEILNLTKDKNKKTIGLFGSWGSGKSTIIEILKNDIGENKVFIFDSWFHKGDFLKRAFLLELARKLKVEKKEYKEKNEDSKLTISKALTRKVIEKFVEPKIEIDFITKTFSLVITIIYIIFIY
ncbi:MULTISPECIES: P-loop NTPase fold protein [unclassified Nitratiruptor]|uniref:P-loop NTPase fold protein n=1 Tax=unclassified Nitratiruptor TaxID=2624044 RepID=UPI00191552DA|nr:MULTISPECIES: P-loop NTPase fold protein [unclassified Nitratiruptor]BCD60389.1 hypothetical protein NitYY0810_C1154 [Nitratiruptor sp. YY08-10]BCD64122.1 hypothetical protein NitYY0814_C0967 [Nitratiruptor sp. YY08-14]